MGQRAEAVRWQFTVDDFHRMGESGIFREGDRVELIEGEVRAMSPIGAGHAGIVNLLAELLVPRLAGKAVISIQNPVRLSRHTEPQPDVSILRYRTDRYTASLPLASDVLGLIEVADSTLEYDRGEKIPLYAQYGVPEVWLVDVDAETVVVYTEPTPQGYRSARPLKRGDTIESSQLGVLKVGVGEIFV